MSEKEKTTHKKSISAISVASFILVIICIFYFLIHNGVESSISAVLGVASGVFVVYILFSISGMLKEFTVKGASFEVSAKLKEEIQNVQKEVRDSNKEICGKINNLNQNIQSINQRIDTVITNYSSSKSQAEINNIENYYDGTMKLDDQLNNYNITPSKIDTSKELPKETSKELDRLMRRIDILENKIGDEISPDPNEVMMRANYYFYNKKYSQALNLYNKVLRIDPENYDAMFNKALSNAELGRYETAIEIYEELLKKDPNSFATYNDLAHCYAKLNNPQKALEFSKKAMELNPSHKDVLFNYACINALVGNKNEALSSLEKLKKISPEKIKRSSSDSDFDSIRDDPRFKKLIG